MVYVEIETGRRADGDGYGYVIHYYKDDKTFEYEGCDSVRGRYADDRDARDAAFDMLDEAYGKRGWRHV